MAGFQGLAKAVVARRIGTFQSLGALPPSLPLVDLLHHALENQLSYFLSIHCSTHLLFLGSTDNHLLNS